MTAAPKTVREPFYKRPFDLFVLAAGHVALLPLWLVLWTVIPLAIWLYDRGPVFYRQERVGKGGRVFTATKFRSMIPDAERHTGAVWSIADDPRITPIGKILRYTALDELPQVLNMWKGDMSIVGPRPERPVLHEKFSAEIPEFHRRLQVRPGLTGMAQVYGHYDLPPDEKLPYDLKYIDRMSLWLDVKLILVSIRNTLLAAWDRPEKTKK